MPASNHVVISGSCSVSFTSGACVVFLLHLHLAPDKDEQGERQEVAAVTPMDGHVMFTGEGFSWTGTMWRDGIGTCTLAHVQYHS